MKLSFVIPAHNEENYIGKCLDSVFAAIDNDSEIEVIVVNNASTDKTREIAARYPRVKIMDEPKLGANRARQTGFLAARAELVANIDADTIITKNWINHALREFAGDKKLVCLSGPYLYYDLPKKIRVLVKFFYAVSFLVYLANRFFFRNASLIQGGNYVVRKSALEKIGGHNTDIVFYGDDADLARRLNRVGKVKFSFAFPIRSSGRRLAVEGAFTMGFRYGINYFWTIFFKRPFSKKSIAVRPSQKNGVIDYRPINKSRERKIVFSLLIIILTFLVGAAFLGYSFVRSGILGVTAAAKIKTGVQDAADALNVFKN